MYWLCTLVKTVNVVFTVSTGSGEAKNMPEVITSLNACKRDLALPPNAPSKQTYITGV